MSVLPERLCLMNIQSSSTYPPLLQGLSQGLLIYQSPPGRVHQECPLAHLKRTYTHIRSMSFFDLFRFKFCIERLK